MNVGICSWAFARSATGRRDVVQLARIAAHAGFTALEGAYKPQGSVSLDSPRPEDLAVPISSLATLEFHRFSLTSRNDAHRQQARNIVDGMLRCAAAWGVASISFSPGGLPRDEKLEPSLRRLAADLAPHVALAAELGVSLALENVPGHLLDSRAAMTTLLNELPGVGVCLDVGNTIVDPPLRAWGAELGEHVLKIHLSDGRASTDGWSPAWLGSGDLDWGEVRMFLREARVDDVFVEVPWDRETDEAGFTCRLARTISKLLEG